MVMSSIAAGLTSAPASAAGILPPDNPVANIAPGSSDWLMAINDARTQEGVGAMDVSESALAGLPLDEQVFTVVNDERVDRGLPPIDYLTSQLDAYAQGGANAGTDPAFPSTLTGGAPITFGGSIWAGGLSSVLEADYYWMYDDGYSGSSTTNSVCSLSDPSGVLGTSRHHFAPVRQLPDRPADPLHGRRVLAVGIRRWFHRRHSRQLVRAPD